MNSRHEARSPFAHAAFASCFWAVPEHTRLSADWQRRRRSWLAWARRLAIHRRRHPLPAGLPYNKPWQIEPIAMTRTRSNGDRCPRRPRQPTMTRRQVLAQSSGFAIGVLTAGSSVLAKGGNPFTLGVAAGDPEPDGFVLWTRLAAEPLAADGLGGMLGPVAVTWEVATDETMRHVVRTGLVEAAAPSAHSLHVEVGGLEPNRPYWYRFAALGARSVIGRARTTPGLADRLDHLRFAFASCSNWQLGYFSAYRHIVEEQPDLVIFLGDYIYEYSIPATSASAGRIVRPHDGPTATDLTGYRNRYALYRTDPDLQALHAAAPCLVTWDDHEVENDYANEWSQDMRVAPADFLAPGAPPPIKPTTNTCRCVRDAIARDPCLPPLRPASVRQPRNVLRSGWPPVSIQAALRGAAVAARPCGAGQLHRAS